MRKIVLSGLTGAFFSLLLVFIAFGVSPLKAQGTTPSPPIPTFTPRPTVAPPPVTVSLSVQDVTPASGSALLVINVSRDSDSWPQTVELLLALPAGVDLDLERLELDGQPVKPVAVVDGPAGEVTFILDNSRLTTEDARQLSLLLQLQPLAGDKIEPISVFLVDPVNGKRVPINFLPGDQEELDLARPVAPSAATEVAPEGAPATEAAAQTTAEPTTDPESAPTSEAAPAATDLLPAATATATPVSPAGDETADGGLGVGNVLVAGLVGGLALLFLLVVLFIVYRIVRRPKPPTSQPIAMHPATAAADAQSPVAAAPEANATDDADDGEFDTIPAAAIIAAGAATVKIPGAKPYLILDKADGKRFDIVGERFTIGRAASSSLVIDDSFTNNDTVSRYHAVIYQQGGRYVIEDLNSQNGVWVNGQAVPKIALADGAEIAIGGVHFQFNFGGNGS